MRFFAAVSLITDDGDELGSLSVAGPQPKGLTEAQKLALRELGRVTVSMLEARRADDAAARLGVVMDGAFNAIFVLDPNTQTISYANRGAQRLLRYSLDELEGCPFCEVIPECTPAGPGRHRRPAFGA